LKTLKFFSLFLMLFVMLAMPVAAQTATDNLSGYARENGLVLRWNSITVDSVETIYSQSLDLTNYDNYAWTTDGVYIGGKATTAAGNPKLVLDYWVCYGDPTVNANWILGNDSLTTVSAATVFSAAITARLTVKAPYIKFKLANLATGRPVTDLDLGIYFIKRDEN
jgi:hypothetical protein